VFPETIKVSVTRRLEAKRSKVTDLTILIHLPTASKILNYVSREVSNPLQLFISALQAALEKAGVMAAAEGEAIKTARYALGIAGAGSEHEVAKEYAYLRSAEFDKIWHGTRYFFLGHPKSPSPTPQWGWCGRSRGRCSCPGAGTWKRPSVGRWWWSCPTRARLRTW